MQLRLGKLNSSIYQQNVRDLKAEQNRYFEKQKRLALKQSPKAKAKVIECINQHPDWNDVRVAESIPCSRSWVQEIRAGLVPVYIEPKLLNHGEKKADSCYYGNTLSERGNNKDYVIARLMRDGQHELADQVKAGTKSARQAAIEAGFKVPESQLTILKRWQK